MTRKKVKLAYIVNESNRKATFKKRKKGLVKKVSELSTLCDVKACAIIYSPYESHPEVWPSPLGAQRVLEDFTKLSDLEQGKKMMNQESFLRQRIGKHTEQLKKQLKDNREKEMTQVMYQSLVGKGMQGLNMADLNDVGWLVDRKLKEIHNRAEAINKKAADPAAQPVIHGQAAVRSNYEVNMERHKWLNEPLRPVAEASNSNSNSYDMEAVQRQHQWFMDLMMNPQEQMGFGGAGAGAEEMVLPPFGDTKYNNDHHVNNTWSGPFF